MKKNLKIIHKYSQFIAVFLEIFCIFKRQNASKFDLTYVFDNHIKTNLI